MAVPKVSEIAARRVYDVEAPGRGARRRGRERREMCVRVQRGGLREAGLGIAARESW